jgi:uncharacterized protein (UPF0264 family)
MQRLLVSVRGPVEALEAATGGAAIADVEFPASALGTPYPLNIRAVRDRLRNGAFGRVLVSTNIGEEQAVRATACQAALGVAAAGADLLKFGLARLDLDAATYLGRSIVRTVRHWHRSKKLYPVVFVDDDLRATLDPVRSGPVLASAIGADGLLIDTYDKNAGRGLLDFVAVDELGSLVRTMHRRGKEAWLAGSITRDDLPVLWATGVDVICVRNAACVPTRSPTRFGRVRASIVKRLVETIPHGA